VPVARRAFVVVWIALGVLGALNHTVFGRRLDLVLPHLRYGHVMFNLNPRRVQVVEFARADGVRRSAAELVPTPAFGYRRARFAVDLMCKADYLKEVCFRAFRARAEELTFFVDEYQVDQDPRRPAHTETLRCDGRGLTPL
jgi:hypothetical protein